jgi:2-amino-4-hydroxy-6-hydroxymethyldihydropteridine diphosphokinase
MSRAVLSIGSNLGDRLVHLASVVATLPNCVVSPVYETAPCGPVPQDDFPNAIIIVDDPAKDARGWLAFARGCEQAAGRTRDIHWGPRTLDVDIMHVVDCNEPVISNDPELILPHPRAHERAFVLIPWVDVEPDAVLIGHGPIVRLLHQLAPKEHAGARRRKDLSLKTLASND